jgi:DNA-binding CsgD family transcriptional regulator
LAEASLQPNPAPDLPVPLGASQLEGLAMGQRFGRLYEFQDRQGRHRRVGAYRPNLAHCFRLGGAPSLVTPTRCGTKLVATEFGIDIPDFRLGLERAWRLMLGSQTNQALTALEAIERQLDDLSPPVATRYRAATEVLRLAVVAFQDDNLAVLAIARVFAEGGASLGMLLKETRSRMEPLEPTDHRPLAFMGSAGNGATPPSGSAGDAITARQRDVLAMIAQGHSNKRIARTLEISPETVKSHVKHIFSKLDVTTRSEAVSQAVLLGLL